MNFLFWNINGNDLQESIHRIVNLHTVDVLVLAECSIDPSELLSLLNRKQADFHYAPSIECRKIEIFTKFSGALIPPILENDRMTIRQLKTPTMAQDTLVAALHFPSQLFWDDQDQLSESPIYSDLIREAEKRVGHHRTVIMGDFNMNPYARGMVNASGFNAVMSREIAEKRKRTIQKREYPFFYNPMWSLSGDISSGPAGTFYFAPKGHSSYYWHTLDQVLIRPDLLECFNSLTLKILDSDGERSLLSASGKPDDSWASDHLPLFFELTL